jgi:hypothetical protein
MKYLSLIRRRADLSAAEFRDYYEQQHAPLALQFFPPSLYQRNYPANCAQAGCDCLSEFDYPDDFDLTQVFLSEAGPALARDESNFMQRDFTRTARAQLKWGRAPEQVSPRSRQLWLFAGQVATEQLLQVLATHAERHDAALYELAPFFCDAFPYTAFLCLENPPAAELALQLSAFAPLCLEVSSCPSPRC